MQTLDKYIAVLEKQQQVIEELTRRLEKLNQDHSELVENYNKIVITTTQKYANPLDYAKQQYVKIVDLEMKLPPS